MNTFKSLILLCASSTLMACANVDLASGKESAGSPEPSAKQLAGDMPIPPGATVTPAVVPAGKPASATP